MTNSKLEDARVELQQQGEELHACLQKEQKNYESIAANISAAAVKAATDKAAQDQLCAQVQDLQEQLQAVNAAKDAACKASETLQQKLGKATAEQCVSRASSCLMHSLQVWRPGKCWPEALCWSHPHRSGLQLMHGMLSIPNTCKVHIQQAACRQEVQERFQTVLKEKEAAADDAAIKLAEHCKAAEDKLAAEVKKAEEVAAVQIASVKSDASDAHGEIMSLRKEKLQLEAKCVSLCICIQSGEKDKDRLCCRDANCWHTAFVYAVQCAQNIAGR